MIECSNCKEWYHKKCIKMKDKLFNKAQKSNTKWYCINCIRIDCKKCNVDVDESCDELLWIQCNQCNEWFHQLCMGISDKQYKELNDSKEKWYCFKCSNNRL